MTDINVIISLTIFLPLITALITNFAGFSLGYKGANILTCTTMIVSVTISWLVFYFFSYKPDTIIYINLFQWAIFDNLFCINWELSFDSLTITMLIVVNTISLLVHIYSTGYMSEDPHSPRFMGYLSLFTFFMIVLVTANNFIQILIGWEGVGLSSYLLINFWHSRVQANKAAIKAMLVNKVGDIALILAIVYVYFLGHSLNFDSAFIIVTEYRDIFLNCVFFKVKALDILCFLLFIGAMGKSAQLGLHTWLPDAMEGPTPVSALIHAATMVTAGIFLIIRCSFLFEQSKTVLSIIAVVGALTAFFGALSGLFLFDIKKIIAYSTCSQLGYMLYSCGLSNYTAGMYHLTNHAFFKALLFLSAGSIIHGLSNEQDIRRFGNIALKMPTTFAAFLVGSLALAGTPYLAGFYSKDLILETAEETTNIFGNCVYFLAISAAFLTAFYSTRLIYLVFIMTPNQYRKIQSSIHESSLTLLFPLLFLSICSIFSGFFLEELFLGTSSEFFKNSIFILPNNYKIVEIEYVDALVKLLPFFFSFGGCILAVFWFHCRYQNVLHFVRSRSFKTQYIFEFFNQKWFFDKNYNNIITWGFFEKTIEKTLYEGYTCYWESWYAFGPGYFNKFLLNFSKKFSTSGSISHYIFLVGISFIALFVYGNFVLFYAEFNSILTPNFENTTCFETLLFTKKSL